jgi:hypothetical protein
VVKVLVTAWIGGGVAVSEAELEVAGGVDFEEG